MVRMSTIIDSIGNAHISAGAPGAGQFARRQNIAPADVLSVDGFDEKDWRARMETIIDAGEPAPTEPPAQTIDLFDPSTWGETPF
jgi:hypothetical protein